MAFSVSGSGDAKISASTTGLSGCGARGALATSSGSNNSGSFSSPVMASKSLADIDGLVHEVVFAIGLCVASRRASAPASGSAPGSSWLGGLGRAGASRGIDAATRAPRRLLASHLAAPAPRQAASARLASAPRRR